MSSKNATRSVSRFVRLKDRQLSKTRLVGYMLAGAVIMTGCSKEPLDISCADFLGMGSNDQLTTAAMWGHPSRDGSYTAADELVAGQYVKDLLDYCSTPGHADDSLKDLEIRFR